MYVYVFVSEYLKILKKITDDTHKRKKERKIVVAQAVKYFPLYIFCTGCPEKKR